MLHRSRLILALIVTATACGAGGATGDPDATDPLPSDGGGVDGATPPTGTQVFDPDVLHTIELTVAPGLLDQLDDNQNQARVRATLIFDGATVAEVGLRKKGATSLRPLADKPGFTVKLNDVVMGQQLDGLKKLTLDNAVQDPSLLVGHVSYEVYRRAGLPAPRTAHATLRFNGVDKGLYVLEESTTADYLAEHFGDGSGNLYEGPWDFPLGVARADLKDEVSENRTRDDLSALTAIVTETPDAQLAAQLATQLDLDGFLDNFAVEMVAVLWDNYAYVAWNYYLYHVPGGRFVMLTHGVNWPYWHAEMDPFDLEADPWGGDQPPGFLCSRILAVPALEARFRAAVTRVARDAFDVPALLARIDRAEATMHSRALTGASATDLAAFDEQLDLARDFVRDRKAYLTTRLGL